MLQNRQWVVDYSWTQHLVQFPDSGPDLLRAPSPLGPSSAPSSTPFLGGFVGSLRFAPLHLNTSPPCLPSVGLDCVLPTFTLGSSDEPPSTPFGFDSCFATLDLFISRVVESLRPRAKVVSPTPPTRNRPPFSLLLTTHCLLGGGAVRNRKKWKEKGTF